MRNEEMLPPHMRDAMRNYLEHGIEPGSFLRCVLQNDLKGACGLADVVNRQRLFDIVFWLYNYAPTTAWGSPEKVETWLDNFKRDFKD